MGAFNRGFASTLNGFWLQAGITLCAAWAFTLFGMPLATVLLSVSIVYKT